MDIHYIIDAIKDHKIKITDHADEEAQADNLSYEEIYDSVIQGEIIEDYPNDKPYPSCLIFGKSLKHQSIHSVWAYNSISKWVVLITVYKPDSNLWINGKYRRKKS